jgi:hypothetical protein
MPCLRAGGRRILGIWCLETCNGYALLQLSTAPVSGSESPVKPPGLYSSVKSLQRRRLGARSRNNTEWFYNGLLYDRN